MEMEAQVILPVMADIIPIDLVVDMLVPMVHNVVVMVVPEMILMEVVQIVPLLLSLEDDINMTDILNSMSYLNRV